MVDEKNDGDVSKIEFEGKTYIVEEEEIWVDGEFRGVRFKLPDELRKIFKERRLKIGWPKDIH